MTLDVQLDITRLTPTIGAEVRGLDCSEPFDARTLAAVREAWLEHLVLFFPDQHLTPDQQTAFARQFGPITTGHPVEPVLEGHREVLPIDSIKDRTNFWHTDVTYMATPPNGSVLYAVTLPAAGGDTMWADTRAAYDTLATPLQSFCDTLVAYHYDPYYAQRIADGEANDWDGERVERLWPVEHPVVRVHPETGRKNLFVNPQFTVGLKGFDGVQGPGLLRVLYDHMTQPQFIVRYRWRPGTLAFWDNRTTMHFGIYDYGDDRRIMHRVTLQGERPHGVDQRANQR
jgi:alpha-ketoglutarate-dependent taurine dioxygenase